MELDKSWDFAEYNPVHLAYNPYYGYGEKPYQTHYLHPQCQFVDASTDHTSRTEFSGMSTNIEGMLDEHFLDLGYHHYHTDFVGAYGVTGTHLGHVMTIADYWLEYSPYDPNSPAYIDPNLYIYDPNHPENWIDPNDISFYGDYNNDSHVDLLDLAEIAPEWLSGPDDPNIVPVIEREDNHSGFTLSINGYTDKTQEVFAYLDGQYLGRVFSFGRMMPVDVEVSTLNNEPQNLKFFSTDNNGFTSASEVTEIVSTTPARHFMVSNLYEPNEPIPFSIYQESGESVTVSVYADFGQEVWSETYTGESIDGEIPAEFSTFDTCIEKVTCRIGNNPEIPVEIDDRFIMPDQYIDPNVIAYIMLPDMKINKRNLYTVKAIEKAFKDRGIKYAISRGRWANYKNLCKRAPYLKYLFYDGHGGSEIMDRGTGQSEFRTTLWLGDGPVVSAKASDFAGTPPRWCADPLKGTLEKICPSMITAGFTDLRFFQHDGCLGGYHRIDPATQLLLRGSAGSRGTMDFTPNDMSMACGLNNPGEDRIYHGWFCESEVILFPQWFDRETSYQLYTRTMWEELGKGRNLQDAMTTALTALIHASKTGSDEADENYRLKGTTDWSGITGFRIKSNP